MSKYRIIKSIASDDCAPYFPQYWEPKQDRWANFQTVKQFGWDWEDVSYETLKEAKKHIQRRRKQEEIDNSPSEVVWEEEDV